MIFPLTFLSGTSLKNLVGGSTATERLKEKIADVKVQAEFFKDRALLCMQQSQALSLQLQKRTVNLQEHSVQIQERSFLMQGQTMMAVRELLSRADALQSVAGGSRGRVERLSSSTAGRIENLSSETIETEEVASSRLLTSSPSNSTTNPSISPDNDALIPQILTAFQYDPALVITDARRLSRTQGRPHKLDDGRVLSLLHNSLLQAWLLVDEPSILLISGRSAPAIQSEISFVMAGLFRSLHAAAPPPATTDSAGPSPGPAVAALAFFCSCHRHSLHDVYACATEVALNLLLQLVDQGEVLGLGHDQLSRCYEDTDPEDLESILDSFEHLVTDGLGKDVVIFVLLDAISVFAETEEQREEMLRIVERLTELGRKQVAPTVKLLFASPGPEEGVHHLFADDEILEVPLVCRPRGRYDERQVSGLIWRNCVAGRAQG